MIRALGVALIALGLSCAAAALVASRWATALWYDGDPAVLADVRQSFAVVAVVCGISLVLVGRRTYRTTADGWAKAGLVLAVAAVVVMADRTLLLAHGLPLWAADSELHFRNRPSKFDRWPNGREIRTNAFGHYDHDFSEKPAPGELRILAVGDSVTLGHMVTREEAFPNRLEKLLAKSAGRPVQVINAAVQGYSTRQERIMIERSLRFEPQMVVIGVCLNDFTEPFTVDADLGGTGLDYHLVKQTGNAFFSYLLHETGFGRAALAAQWSDTTPELEKLRESQDVEAFSRQSPDDPAVRANYAYVLEELERVYELGRKEDLAVVVLLFPYAFQFDRPETLNPQRAVMKQAAEHGVPLIDFYAFLEPRVAHSGASAYFQDLSHLTPAGHEVVAREIHRVLADMLPE